MDLDARRALLQSRRFVDAWLAKADPQSGLIPENLEAGIDHWNGRNNAADNYPFMVLTAALTDRPLFEGRLLEMLRTEQRSDQSRRSAGGLLQVLDAHVRIPDDRHGPHHL